MNLEKLKSILETVGEPDYRFRQIYRAVFKNLCLNFEEMTDLPAELQRKLAKEVKPFSLKLKALEKGDGAEKALFELEDNLLIESVLMRHKYGRETVCISSQVGCPLGCRFCATGQTGFKRNLDWQEMVEQVLFFAKKSKGRKPNVVFMGMGEPFLNYDNVMEAITILKDRDGFGLAERAISISTVGIVPEIRRFTEENLEVNLAISLNAADDEQRSELMPVNRRYPITEVIKAAKDYVRKTRRKVFFEYILLKDVNDDAASARKLADLLRGTPLSHVNLIRYHETGTGFESADEKTVSRFKKELERNGLNVTVRHSFGQEIKGACGQLATSSPS